MKKAYEIINDIYDKYWIGYPPHSKKYVVKKTIFEIEVLKRSLGELEGKTVIDVGGGWGIYSAACSALGMNTILIDDFGDKGKNNEPDPRDTLPNDYGFKFVRKDILSEGFEYPSGTIDAITTFHMLEHLHASPKDFLHDAMRVLKHKGILFIGVTNCVNLHTRISVPLGKGSWSAFAEWYEPKVFRGHVREPDVADLRKIAEDLSLRDFSIFGRNWQGIGNSNKLIRIGTKFGDKILRNCTSLCSDIYLLGYKS